MKTFTTSMAADRRKTGKTVCPSDRSWRAQTPAIRQVLHRTALQPKLTIGAPNGAHEREADRVADQVMRMSDTEVQSTPAPTTVQRLCSECEEEVRTKPEGEGSNPAASVPPIVHDVLRSSGNRLDAETRAFFEPLIGGDFSRVRVHSDAAAALSAREVIAHAYTAGQDIVFGAGRFAPGTHEGRGLIADELTHVVQQNAEEAGSNLPRETMPRLRSESILQRQPASNACPRTITTNTNFTSDCSGGIVVGADKIILDCNGHTLTGSNTGAGILLRGRTEVTVENCNMKNFREGVALRRSEKNIFIKNSTDNCGDGFDLNESNSNIFVANEIINSSVTNGIELDTSNQNIFVSNNVSSNPDGIDLNNSNKNGFTLNNANNNNRDGFRITQTSNENNFTSNNANDNGSDGFHIEDSNDNTFILNSAGKNSSDDFGLPSGTGNICSGNTFTHRRCPPS